MLKSSDSVSNSRPNSDNLNEFKTQQCYIGNWFGEFVEPVENGYEGFVSHTGIDSFINSTNINTILNNAHNTNMYNQTSTQTEALSSCTVYDQNNCDSKTNTKSYKDYVDDVITAIKKANGDVVNGDVVNGDVTNNTDTDETSTEITSIDETSIDETSIDEASIDETSTEITSIDETSIDETSTDETSTDDISNTVADNKNNIKKWFETYFPDVEPIVDMDEEKSDKHINQSVTELYPDPDLLICLEDMSMKICSDTNAVNNDSAADEINDVVYDVVDEVEYLLLYAALYGNIDAVKELIRCKGAKCIDQALIVSTINNNVEIAQYMLELGADISTDDYLVFFNAVWNGHIESIECLITAGIDLRQYDDYIMKSMHNHNSTEMFQYALDAGVSVYAEDNAALKHIAQTGNLDMFECLINANVSADTGCARNISINDDCVGDDSVNDDYVNDGGVNDDYVDDDYVDDSVNDDYVDDEYVNNGYVNADCVNAENIDDVNADDADVSSVSVCNGIMLKLAAQHNQMDMVDRIIELNPNRRECSEAVLAAVTNGHLAVVERLFTLPLTLNLEHVLEAAIVNNYVDVAEYILDHANDNNVADTSTCHNFSDCNSSSGDMMDRLLIMATFANMPSIVRRLVKLGANMMLYDCLSVATCCFTWIY